MGATMNPPSPSVPVPFPSPPPPPLLGPVSAPRSRPGTLARAKGYLLAHPVLFLALLTPGIPEYISGSSALANIVLNPVWFVLGLAFNLGMYVPGVLLIREAQVRWNKGWATVLALGAAYAIVEEGIGLNTMFDPKTSPFGAVGNYGHYLGVNWVWVPEVMLIHMIFSIGVPLLLFAYVFPELRGKSLLSKRGILTVAAILGIDITILVIFVSRLIGYWMGDGVLLGSLLAVAGICALAYWLPKNLLRSFPGLPKGGPVSFAIVGTLFYLGSIVMIGALEHWQVPAILVALAVPVYCGTFLWWLIRHAGSHAHERQLVAFCFGLILPLIMIGAATQILVPIVLGADLLAVLLFRHLYRNFPAAGALSWKAPPPPGVAAPLSQWDG
ncbi:MAG: hypothetical protein L3K14_01895 [Thermoplasmata archaeon]|nr:hypothetical protein [Thermoplasmata archaeon]